jgi:SAM-dependent methyltransferase
MSKKKTVDAYGEELWDLYKGSIQFELIERDDNFIQSGEYGKIYFAEYKDWSKMEQQAIELVKGRVLDIGCGAARHAIYLQKKGLDVLGIDNSPIAIKISRLRGLKKAKALPIEKIDSLKRGSIDTIIMLGNNFGLFASPKKAKQLLRKMYQITSDNALIITETRDVYNTK